MLDILHQLLEKALITGNGNVGIGNPSPTNKLSVTGNADFSGNVGIGNSYPTNKLSVIGNSDFSGNMGIGLTNPLKAKFAVSSNVASGTTNVIFGQGQAGISFQQNYPPIGFNQYRDLANANASKYMANGFAAINYLNPSTGEIVWESFPAGSSDATTMASGTRSLTLLPNGDINTSGNINTNGSINTSGNINTTGKYLSNNTPVSPVAYGHISPTSDLTGSFFGGTYEIKDVDTYTENIVLTFTQNFTTTPTLIINRDNESERALKNVEYNTGGFANKIKIKFGQSGDTNFGSIYCSTNCSGSTYLATIAGSIPSDYKVVAFSFVVYGQ